jgi:hypothetical protein
MNAGMEVADRENWNEGCHWSTSQGLSAFTRQLAEYGDGEHPLFAQAELIADAFPEAGQRFEIYFSLGVSRAILGDHDNARRLLRQGIEASRQGRIGIIPALGAGIVAAWSHEQR